MMGKLIIVRHGESEWNKLGKWTGTRDRHLTDYGFEKAEDMGLLIKDISIDHAFASMQVRSIETLSCMLNVCERYDVPTEHTAALNERDYGDYTAKDKAQMEQLLGEEEYKKLRRSWEYSIPNGETLKTVYSRAVPYFLEHIVPLVREGNNVLVVGHGNSLRTLIKYIENISDEGIADVEMPFNTVIIYDLDSDGHMVHKEVRQTEQEAKVSHSKAQIVATIGPASEKRQILESMIEHQMGVARLNFSWADPSVRARQIDLIRELATERMKHIPIIVDLPGPRISQGTGHTYDSTAVSALTDKDKEYVRFSVDQKVEYIALSFVGGPEDIVALRDLIKSFSGTQKIIAKIERKVALELIDEIIAVADAVMIARGDLGNEIPLEQIPFAQESIIKKCKIAGKPVIVATQMLLSMVENATPSRAEVTDVTDAVLQGSDAVMLSEETAMGKYPVETVIMMEKIVVEAKQHMGQRVPIHPL